MRVLFTFCFVLCTVAVTAPLASDAEIVSVSRMSALSATPDATAIPTIVIVKLTPAPTSAPAPSAASHAANPVLAPTRPVAKVAVPAAAPAPKPTVAPTPKATAKPRATATPTAKPTSKPTPKPSAPAGRTYTRDQVIAGIRAGWGGDDDRAIAVADCESSLNPRASSSGGTYLGLWQFHIETWHNYGGSGDPRDHSPQVQTQVAWNVFQDRGWAAWPGC
jgi:hypothetical protein